MAIRLAEASAAASTTQQAVPGFFLFAWGLFATVLGLGLVTNFRGLADKFAYHGRASTLWMRRVPPWRWMRRDFDEDEDAEELADRVKLARLIAIPFAILGPVMTVAGVVLMLRGHVGMPRGPRLPLPIGLVFIGGSLVAMFQYWRPGRLLRLAARQGGWLRAVAIVTSLGAVSFGVFTFLGLTTLGIAGWLVGALSSASLLMSRRPLTPSSVARDPFEADRGRRPW